MFSILWKTGAEKDRAGARRGLMGPMEKAFNVQDADS